MRYWFSADYHMGHANIIRYCNRPFKSLEQMNDTIIRNHNARVKPDDILIHVGDFCFRNSSYARGEGVRTPAQEWESKLNGKIIHIKGNHDKNNGLKTIVQGVLVEFMRHRVWCVHRPLHYNNEYDINFVGHVHNNWDIKLKGDYIFDKNDKIMILKSDLINVGVDVNKFMPVSFEELIKKLNKRRKMGKK